MLRSSGRRLVLTDVRLSPPLTHLCSGLSVSVGTPPVSRCVALKSGEFCRSMNFDKEQSDVIGVEVEPERIPEHSRYLWAPSMNPM